MDYFIQLLFFFIVTCLGVKASMYLLEYLMELWKQYKLHKPYIVLHDKDTKL